MQNLINQSKEILKRLNIHELQKAGIVKENIKMSSHSHIIVTYPPLDALPEIQPTEIYPPDSIKCPREIALYLHLPFCTGKCLYCAYVTLAKQTKEFIERYIEAVRKEIVLLLRFPILQDITVSSLYIGGGTPTYLSIQQLDKIFNLLRGKFNVKQDAEITIEVGPETIIGQGGRDKLQCLLQNGVNRLSIGFQTFNDNILGLVGRRHNSEQAINSYKLAKEVGFKNINIDLIVGLPEQTLEIWQNDLEQVVKLKPPSITCYPFYLKKNAAIWSMYQKETGRFPSRENITLMRIMANEFLSKIGYGQSPVYWFSKSPEYVYKQQIHKWGALGEQLALGVSSYSFINNFQYFNFRTVSQYLNALENSQLPIWKGVKLSQEDLMRRLIIFGLKTGLNKDFFESRFGKSPKEVFKQKWKKLEKLGLVEENEKTIQLSYKGKLFADEVAKEFFSDDVRRAINKII